MSHAHPAALVARRWFLQQCGVGLGAAALASLMANDGTVTPGVGPGPVRFKPADGLELMNVFVRQIKGE